MKVNQYQLSVLLLIVIVIQAFSGQQTFAVTEPLLGERVPFATYLNDTDSEPEIESTAPGVDPSTLLDPNEEYKPRRTSILNDAGEFLGSDDPTLTDDAREAKNLTNVVGSALEEFTGINTQKYTGYLDLLFGLFKRKKKNSDFKIPDPREKVASGDSSVSESDAETSISGVSSDEDDMNQTIGAAGLPVATLVNDAIQARAVAIPKGKGGLFAVSPTIAIRTFQRGANLELSKDALNLSLGVEGQEYNALVQQQVAEAAEAASTISDEIQEVVASQDAIKLSSKIGKLQAAIAKVNVAETQQVKLAQQQANQALFEMQGLMQARSLSDTVDSTAQRIAVIKAAQTFSGAFQTGDSKNSGDIDP